MTKKKRLGRGLDALLSKPVSEAASVTGGGAEKLENIPLDLLQRGRYQPRVDMRQDTLEDLANSIRSQGVVQPIVARPLQSAAGETQKYEIVAGERRWRAAQLAGLAEIPAVVRDVDDDAAIAVALIENIQRENLNPLEEARALERLIREFDLTHQQAAETVGRSRAAVSNLLRLLELSEKVRPMLESRQLEMGHARALLSRQKGAAGGECRYPQAGGRHFRAPGRESAHRPQEKRCRKSRRRLQQPGRTRRHPQAPQITSVLLRRALLTTGICASLSAARQRISVSLDQRSAAALL
jgi:ParB family chromosome partitioning protein